MDQLLQNTFFRDFIKSIQNYRQVIPFIRKHQLWKGALEYSWVTKFLLIVGILVSLKFSNVITDFFVTTNNQGFSFSKLSNTVGTIASEGYDIFVVGSYKYVILILMEVVIFHFARKTLEVLTGEDADASLRDFIKAQIRMLKVAIFAYVMEMVLTIVAGVPLSIFDVEWLKPIVNFIIQCFFLGYLVVDNYNEIYEMKIKQSFQYTRQYAGVAIAIGLVVYLLMLIPVFGALLGPLLGAVTATITMHELNKMDDSMETVFVDGQF